VAGIDDVVLVVVAVATSVGKAAGALGQAVVGQVAMGLAAHHAGVQAPLVAVLHLLAAMPVQLGLQRAAPAPLSIILGSLVRGVQPLEHRTRRLAAVLEEGLLARIVGGAGTDILLGAVHDLRTGGCAGSVRFLAAHSRFVRVFGGVLQGTKERLS